MAKFINIRIGDICQIKHGYAFKSKYFSNIGKYILLTPGNFKPDGGIKLQGEKEKYYSGDFPKEYILKRGDMVLVMTDILQTSPILGSPGIIKKDDEFLHNQRLGKIIDIKMDIIIPQFLYWIFNSRTFRGGIKGSATGATVKHTAPERIYTVEVKIPESKDTQRKIASILSAYDDLIEINERRIKILEEMARLIYKEWFAKFRFPGHEKVKMIESELGLIPEGWEVERLGDVIELTYGKGLKEENRIPGEFPVYGSSGIVGTHVEKFVDGPGIIVGRKGNVGSITWSHSDFYPIDTVFYVKPKSEIKSMYFLFQALSFQDFKNLQGDAAVPGLNRNLAYLNDFLAPNIDVIKEYEKVVIPIFQLVEVLKKTNHSLRQTRDLLLPKLISGNIDVSGFGH